MGARMCGLATLAAVVVTLCALPTPVAGQCIAGTGTTNVPDVTSIPGKLDHVFGGLFSKYINVFGVNIVATSETDDAKIKHAASVMAQYLDNDQDGVPDDQAVVDQLHSKHATLVMFKDEDEEEEFFGDPMFMLSNIYQFVNILANGLVPSIQNLYDFETFPTSVSLNRFSHDTTLCPQYSEMTFDAALEEVLHLITHVGVSKVYPGVFGEDEGSQLAGLIDPLNGDCGWGYSDNYIDPSSGGFTGWYAYDDDTCDYACTQTEGIYWALTSILGAQNYTERIQGTANEWRLCQPADVQAQAPALYALLTDDATHPWLPTTLPDGRYTGTLPAAKIGDIDDVALIVFIVFALVVSLLCLLIFCCCKKGKCECCPKCCCFCCRPKQDKEGAPEGEGGRLIGSDKPPKTAD